MQAISTRIQGASTAHGAKRAVQARPSVAARAALSATDLAAFKADDLSELCRKKGVSGGRTATRDSLTSALLKAGVTLADLSRGQLVDLGVKLGKAGLPRDLNAARRELERLVGGGSSASYGGNSTASWRSTPSSQPAATSSGDRWASYSRGSTPAAAAGGSATGAGLSHSDLAALRIDDLRDLVKKTGTQLPREPTKDGLISALVSKGVNLSHCTRGMLVDLCNKLGAPMAKDAETMKRNLAAVVGRGGGAASAPSSWRSSPSAAPAAPVTDRFSSYSAGASQKASWRRSGSYTAGASSGSGLSAGDLSSLRIDDLGTIAKKVGVALGREPTKDGLINALVSKGVTVNDLPRAALVDLCTRLGVATARDAETMKRNLASVVGKGGAAAPAASSSWRSTPAAAPAAPSGGRFASYSGNGNGNGSSSSWRSGGSSSSAAGGSDALYEADLSSLRIDDLTQLARKVGVDVRNATKDSLARTLVTKATVADLSKGNLVDILSKIGQPISGSIEDLRSRVRAAASSRQSARQLVGAGSRW